MTGILLSVLGVSTREHGNESGNIQPATEVGGILHFVQNDRLDEEKDSLAIKAVMGFFLNHGRHGKKRKNTENGRSSYKLTAASCKEPQKREVFTADEAD